jgi:hypothetical protein
MRIMIQSFIHFLEQHLMVCPYRSLTGYDCPGCGMQRSVIELLKGNFIHSFQFYPALLPVFFTLILTGFHLKFKLKNGAAYVKYSFLFTVTIVVISYSAKMFL